jgi:hypothetical protein
MMNYKLSNLELVIVYLRAGTKWYTCVQRQFYRSQWPRGLRHELSSPLKHWDRGFESHLRHGCLCAFTLCLCSPVCR